MNFLSSVNYIEEDVAIFFEFDDRQNLCSPTSCNFIGVNNRYIVYDLNYFKLNRAYYISQNCDIQPNEYVIIKKRPLNDSNFGDYIENLFSDKFPNFNFKYVSTLNAILFYHYDCSLEFKICEASCFFVEFTHYPILKVDNIPSVCSICNYSKTFSVLHGDLVEYTISDFTETCPECPDYTDLISVIPGETMNGIVYKQAKIIFSGKLSVINPSRIHLSFTLNGESIQIFPCTSPEGNNVYCFAYPNPGTHVLELIIDNNVYCKTIIEVTMNELSCLNSKITLDFVPPNTVFINDENQNCSISALNINQTEIDLSSLSPNINLGEGYFDIDSVISGYPALIRYENDCGCILNFIKQPDIDLPNTCTDALINSRMETFFRALNQAVITNVTNSTAISLPPYHQNPQNLFLTYFINNCGTNCIQEIFYPGMGGNADLQRFISYVFECGHSLNYVRNTNTYKFRNQPERHLIEDILNVTITSIDNLTRFYYKFILVVDAPLGSEGPIVVIHKSGAAKKSHPLNLNTDPILYSVGIAEFTSPAINIYYSPINSSLNLF